MKMVSFKGSSDFTSLTNANETMVQIVTHFSIWFKTTSKNYYVILTNDIIGRIIMQSSVTQ